MALVDGVTSVTKPNRKLIEFCQAVADDLEMLASLHDREPTAALLRILKQEKFPDGLGLVLESESGRQVIEFLHSELALIADSVSAETLDDLAADYASIYLNHAIQASPEESVWLDEDSLACQRSMFQVRGWYSRYGLSATDWRKRPDDHLVLELQFIAHLLRASGRETDLEPVGRFMDEHLLRWLPQFAVRVGHRCDTGYFSGVALLTGEYCSELRDLIAGITGQARPTAEEIEQRMKPTQEVVEEPVKYVPGVGPAV